MRRSEGKAKSEKRNSKSESYRHGKDPPLQKPNPQGWGTRPQAKSEKQIPHTARKRRERVSLEDRDTRDDRVDFAAAGFPRGSGQRDDSLRPAKSRSKLRGKMRPSAWARLPAAGRLKRRPYMIWVPFFFKKGNNGCWLLTKCIQRLHF